MLIADGVTYTVRYIGSAFYLFDNKCQDLKEQANFDDKETAAPRVFWRQNLFNSLSWD